ncbi:sigma-54 dependent transcriptional regulator [Fontisphaera persica]|uniref:sigma-54-dependent transcriptional regulator n=1 Tax=Fontisphaera persica TaxID=2974023 RepID=UPI0024C01D8A|nr:sigma-54 dependent transcriptional regulator [Fontisphaera persica]WCJ59504.1 sigma-54 dependent transcriptional regulator [Fontisphaera persica]
MYRLLLIDDEADVQYSFRRLFEGPEIEVATASSGEEGLRLIPRIKPDLVLMDVRMAGMSGLETLRRLRQTDARLPVIIMTAYGTTQTAIEAMKLGAYDYLLKPFDVPKLKEVVAAALRASQAMRQTVTLETALSAEDVATGMVGRSAAMQEVFKLIGQLAASDATVLITGESGTGKELAARAIYSHSRRAQQPFLAINCAAIPETLLESELFGHEKGAFTGATTQRIGKFEQCHGGTLFLDEIGDMSPATQTKILRVLQSGEFERVGGNQTVKVDVRVIAATNRPLEQAVAEKKFREDLFYRLNVVRLHLPPLRERKEDLPLLVEFFLRKLARASGRPRPGVAPQTLALLTRHDWPGNVRELENVMHRALVVAKGDTLLPEDLPAELRGAAPSQTVTPAALPHAAAPPAPAAPPPAPATGDIAALVQGLFEWARQDPRRRLLPAVERELVLQALRETGGNQVQAARLLGMTRATLRKRIERYGIRRQISVQ